ncbi:hypothetical protein C1909_10615 [Listeria ivanovii]|uniref:hypothetical protein n=1 Tax=Listeria ivanovii TaxID=1638 RepID=UPI0003ECAA8B|nr:hypothetical protein [Listeria ivanovii]AHI57339.1 hypothetical protein AX25_14340 [Listeria ivanovii WSLC3009]AIS66597.1 hypothetical protein JL52_14110 [Listeria ivanovii subsp. ivanovii]PZG37741.1 hypothetical protein C1910_10600 [Listeria ivanovii]PZG51768.1 hypothetical protein C1909_10615 [Listeria ivanovii]
MNKGYLLYKRFLKRKNQEISVLKKQIYQIRLYVIGYKRCQNVGEAKKNAVEEMLYQGEATESVVVENKGVHKVEIVEDISVDGLLQKMGENNTFVANMENKHGSITLAVPLAPVNTTNSSNYTIDLIPLKLAVNIAVTSSFCLAYFFVNPSKYCQIRLKCGTI